MSTTFIPDCQQVLFNKSSGPLCSKLNEVVSKCDVKISVLKYGKYIDMFF